MTARVRFWPYLGEGIMRLLVAGLALASVAGVASADAYKIVVSPSLAPNAFGSPSFADYQSNAVTAIVSNASTHGDPSSPAYYEKITGPISVATAIVTGFPSWRGDANVSGAYANEYGNRVTFGVDITSTTGSQFSISQLSFSAATDDATNSLGFSYAAGAYNYSAGYVGILYGTDGQKGGGDDVYITSGLNTQLVNEIVGRGSGNSWAVYSTDPGATNQEKIDNGASAVWAGRSGSNITFTATYSIDGSSDSAAVVFDAPNDAAAAAGTPLPSAAASGTFLLAALGLGARRRKPRAA
jgi:hypothetical protein